MVKKTKMQYAEDWDSLMQYQLVRQDDGWLNRREFYDLVRGRDNAGRITEYWLDEVANAAPREYDQHVLRGAKLDEEIRKVEERLKELKAAKLQEVEKQYKKIREERRRLRRELGVKAPRKPSGSASRRASPA